MVRKSSIARASGAGRTLPRPALRGLCALAVLAAAGCARVAPPGGGPQDETPPEVISTTPVDGATDVPLSTEVSIEFSEEMSRSSAERALSITPPVGTTRFRWRGPALSASFDEELPDSTTFVVTLGEGATDYHGVVAGAPFRFAFSTGPTLDDGIIEGRVERRGEPAAGALVWACTGPAAPDTLGRLLQCGYATRAGDDGRFRFDHVRPAGAPYALVAFLDESGDGRYDPVGELGTVLETAAALAAQGDSVGGLVMELGSPDGGSAGEEQ